MRLTIIPSDNSVYMNGIGYSDLDMTWIPEIDGKKIHAVQWLDHEGEIEFVGPHQNQRIVDLSEFEKAITLWNDRKAEEDFLRQQQSEAEERRRKEEEERLRSQFLDFDDQFERELDEFDENPNIAPSETHIPPVEPLMYKEENEDEDEDLFYDIEELLREI